MLLDAKVLFLTAKFVRFSLVALLSAVVYSIAVAVRPHRYVLSSAKESPHYKAHFVFARMPQAVSLGNVGTASRYSGRRPRSEGVPTRPGRTLSRRGIMIEAHE